MKGLMVIGAVWLIVTLIYIYRWVMEEPGRA